MTIDFENIYKKRKEIYNVKNILSISDDQTDVA